MGTSTPAYALAARQPLALLVLLAALAAGLTVALWLLPLGLVAYGAVVWLRAHDLTLVAQAQRPTRPRLSSPTFRAQLETIEHAQKEIERSIGQANGALGRLLMPVSQQASELLAESYTLCDKGQIIESYLATRNPRALHIAAQDGLPPMQPFVEVRPITNDRIGKQSSIGAPPAFTMDASDTRCIVECCRAIGQLHHRRARIASG